MNGIELKLKMMYRGIYLERGVGFFLFNIILSNTWYITLLIYTYKHTQSLIIEWLNMYHMIKQNLSRIYTSFICVYHVSITELWYWDWCNTILLVLDVYVRECVRVLLGSSCVCVCVCVCVFRMKKSTITNVHISYT